MASKLSKATNTARKGLIVFFIFAISTFLFRFIFGLTEDPTNNIRPTAVPRSPYLQTNEALGNIPYPDKISLSSQPGETATYSIQDQAVLPEFPPVVNVYRINKPREKLGNSSKGIQVAGKFELNSIGRVIADNQTLWQNPETSRSLEYDKLYELWDYEIDLTKEQLDAETAAKMRLSTNTEFYNDKGTSIMSMLTLMDSFFNRAKSRIDYINMDTQTRNISLVDTPRNATFVRIKQSRTILSAETDPDYRPAQGEIAYQSQSSEIRNAKYNDGIANIIVRGSLENIVPDIVDFKYRQFNYGEKGIYPALTSTEAFLRIQAGEGILYWIKLQDADPYSNHQLLSVLEYIIEAPKTELVYVEPEVWDESIPQSWTHFLQPYYLFEGVALLTDGREADFAYLVPALKQSEYILNN